MNYPSPSGQCLICHHRTSQKNFHYQSPSGKWMIRGGFIHKKCRSKELFLTQKVDQDAEVAGQTLDKPSQV